MTTETEDKEARESFLGIAPNRRWRTRTSKIKALHEPVPRGVWIGFIGSGLLFVMLHFFNKWWWKEDFIP